jgi:transposase-like protein
VGKDNRHSEEYIAESIRLITEEGWTQAQVAESADVHPNTVAKWIKKAGTTGKTKAIEDAKDKRIRELEFEH